LGFIKLCIERPVFVVMIESLLIVLGLIGYNRIGVDLYPKIDPPVITVTTRYPGAGPEEVEVLVSKKIEDQVNQIGGIERIVSTSQQNISRVVVEFKLEVDAKSAQADVRDKVQRIRSDLPDDIEEPLIERLNFEDRAIATIALKPANSEAANKYNEGVLRLMGEQTVRPLIQRIDGVGQVNVFGGREREVQVHVDRIKLQSFNIGVPEIADAIRKGNINTPSGEISEMPSRRSLRVIGQFANVADISATIVKTLPGGRVVRVADIAQVEDGLKEQTNLVRVGGDPAVLLEVKKQSDANTVSVAEKVLGGLGEMNASLPEGVRLEAVYDGARFIRASVHDVIETIVIAGILAIVVVYFFLGSMQSTLITGLALPCTIVGSFSVLHYMGYTLNIMSLLGLTLSVGLILDDAIVIRENIWAKIEKGMEAKAAALHGTSEVMVAVLATSLTVLAVFFPVTFIPGITGRFFAAFAVTVCIGIILSTFDAVTIAPMLSANVMRKGSLKHLHSKNKALVWFDRQWEYVSNFYAAALRICLRQKGWTVIAAAVFFAISIGLMKQVGFTFLPDDESGEFEVNLEALPGTSFERMSRIAGEVEAQVRKNAPEVAFTSIRVGNELEETNVASVYARMVPFKERSRTTSQVKTAVRQSLRPFTDVEKLTISIRNPGNAGGGRPVTMVVQGPDNDVLRKVSMDLIQAATEKVPGVAGLETNLKPGRQELQVVVNRDNASAFGLRIDEIGQQVRGLYEGIPAGVYRELGEEYDIRVRLKADQRSDALALDGFSMPNDRGAAVPLNTVARAQVGVSPTSIVRIDLKRSARIEGDLVPGFALNDVVTKLRDLAGSMLPPGYSLDFQGQAKSLRDLRAGAVVALGLGALFIYMVMASLYESFILPFSILMTLPLAIVGAILALLVSGKFMDIYGVIGIILLMALVTKNAILLVDYAEQLRAEGMERHDALFTAGTRRMRPIVMTTIAMVAGMLPVAFGYGEINKVRAGMGIATIGGLISSTVLSLVVVPCVYLYLDNVRAWGSRMVARYRET
jgi:HAE1 family hydrophobic/amphiphilic exporter-1